MRAVSISSVSESHPPDTLPTSGARQEFSTLFPEKELTLPKQYANLIAHKVVFLFEGWKLKSAREQQVRSLAPTLLKQSHNSTRYSSWFRALSLVFVQVLTIANDWVIFFYTQAFLEGKLRKRFGSSGDPVWQVNLLALEGVIRLASCLGTKLESVANTLLPAVCKTLASTNQQVGHECYEISRCCFLMPTLHSRESRPRVLPGFSPIAPSLRITTRIASSLLLRLVPPLADSGFVFRSLSRRRTSDSSP